MRPTIASLLAVLACSEIAAPMLAQANPEPIPGLGTTGGMRFESQGAGTPNSLSGFLFVPVTTSDRGDVFFVDGSVGYGFGGELFGDDSSLDISSRLGYRFLANRQWILGLNAGVDASLYGDDTYAQVGVGMEALARGIEFRLNGYIPVTTASKLLDSGSTVEALVNNRLILEKSDTYLVQLGGFELEAGLPVVRFSSGDLWLYGAYYLLSGDQISTYSGVRARVQANLDSRISVGGTISYDDLFKTQASGYVSYRFAARSRDSNRNDPAQPTPPAPDSFLARRGLPVDRQARIRFTEHTEDTVLTAKDPSSGEDLEVRCVGSPSGGSAREVECRYTDLADALAGSPDAVLVASDFRQNLEGQNLRLARGTWLSNSANAPTLRTQVGSVSLSGALESGNGKPSLRNANLYLESGSAVAGFRLRDVNLGSRSNRQIRLLANDLTNSSVVITAARDLSLLGNHFFWDGTSQGPPLPPSWGYPTRKDPQEIILRSITNLEFSGNTLKAANVRDENRSEIGVDTDRRLAAEGYGTWRVQDNVFGQAGTADWVDPFLTLRSGASLTFTGNTIAGNTVLSIRAPLSTQLRPSTGNEKSCRRDANGTLLTKTAFCQANTLDFNASYNNPGANDNLIILRTDLNYED
jgi:hypothetical protein